MLAIAGDGDLTIRAMRDDADDYRLLVRWRGETHANLQLNPRGVRCESVQFDQLTTVSVSLVPRDRD